MEDINTDLKVFVVYPNDASVREERVCTSEGDNFENVIVTHSGVTVEVTERKNEVKVEVH